MLISVLFHIPIWPPTGPSEVLKGAGGFFMLISVLFHIPIRSPTGPSEALSGSSGIVFFDWLSAPAQRMWAPNACGNR